MVYNLMSVVPLDHKNVGFSSSKIQI